MLCSRPSIPNTDSVYCGYISNRIQNIIRNCIQRMWTKLKIFVRNIYKTNDASGKLSSHPLFFLFSLSRFSDHCFCFSAKFIQITVGPLFGFLIRENVSGNRQLTWSHRNSIGNGNLRDVRQLSNIKYNVSTHAEWKIHLTAMLRFIKNFFCW